MLFVACEFEQVCRRAAEDGGVAGGNAPGSHTFFASAVYVRNFPVDKYLYRSTGE